MTHWGGGGTEGGEGPQRRGGGTQSPNSGGAELPVTLAQGPGVSGEVLKARAGMLGVLSGLFGEFRGFPSLPGLGYQGLRLLGKLGGSGLLRLDGESKSPLPFSFAAARKLQER